jgi:hypothetical protein
MDTRLTLAIKVGAIVAAAAGAVAIVAPAAGERRETPARPLTTAVYDPELVSSPDPNLALERVRGLGARAVRVILYWRQVAPAGNSPNRPSGFDAADPADPNYAWSPYDAALKRVARHGLTPIVGVQQAPGWAEGPAPGRPGTRRPNAEELALFATAAAKRYSGRFGDLPRVRYWQVWNEPNLGVFLNPQVEQGKLVSPELYRELVNRFSAAVHAVHADNLVIAGGTAPFGRRGSANGTPPLQFMRALLCLSGRTTLKRVCEKQTDLDVWAHNPYTLGEPTRQAIDRDNVSLGDLPRMRDVLFAAGRAGTITGKRTVPFWVTEFSWDSNPPDPEGVPAALHTRWVAEALYQMWTAGVSLVTWFQLRDDPRGATPFQSGLYLNDGPGYSLDKPKGAATAFRFPFVAFRDQGRVLVWGRSPTQTRVQIRIEQLVGDAWRTVASFSSDTAGIFTASLRLTDGGSLRARLPDNETSAPFSLTVPPPLTLVNPFGT